MRQLLKSVVNKRTQVPAIDELVWRFAGGVVAAEQSLSKQNPHSALKISQHFKRVFPQEGEIICRVDNKNFLRRGCEALHVRFRADRGKQLMEPCLSQSGIFESLANVPRALAGPRDVAKRDGRMIKGVHAQTRIVRAGDKPITGAETRAENAELLIPLRLKPVQAAANIDNRLPARSDSPANV